MESINKLMGAIAKVGDRECDDCGATVPIYKNKGQEVSVCMACENEKVKQEAESYYHERKQRRTNELIETCEVIPEEIKSATFGGYQPITETQRYAKDMSLKFCENKLNATTLLFQGTPGTGKSHLSYCIASEIKKQGRTVLFIDSPSLMTIIRGTYQKGSALSQEKFMQLVQEVDLLVLDDIGAEYVKQDPNGLESWAADIIFQIVNARQGKRNVYTTNYNGEQLAKKYGLLSGRIVSRMMNNAQRIKVEGKDHRLGGFE